MTCSVFQEHHRLETNHIFNHGLWRACEIMAVSGQDTIVLNADSADLCLLLGVAKRTIIKVLLNLLGFTEGSQFLKDYWQAIYTCVYLFFF